MAAEPALTVRERLIRTGIEELSIHGIQDFSVRRVASACGVSCAAPYKHFEDRNRFIADIIEYVIHLWETYIPEVIAKYPNDLRTQLTEISVRYVHFLVENSHFRSIIMLKDPDFDQQYSNLRHRLSSTSRSLIREYAKSVHMPEQVMTYKLYVVRSLIYGAALMFDNGEMEYNEENMEFVRRAISREFELP
jgi:AcrR family transcriptional regulator